MTLPAGGWLADADITGGLPYEGPLPEEYVGTYSEGGNGVLLGTTELDFTQIELIFDLSFIRERFGYGESIDSPDLTSIFTIQMVQAAVFGVLLLDSFTPPRIAAEFFEFVAYQQLACDGLGSTEVAFGACPDGAVAVMSEEEGAVVAASVFDGTRVTYRDPGEAVVEDSEYDAGIFGSVEDTVDSTGTFGETTLAIYDGGEW